MSLFVDDREGSSAVCQSLIDAGLPAELTRLEFGDIFFVGRGQGGAPVNIGIEHKTTGDLISSLKTGRLQGHQLPGMKAAEAGDPPMYDFAWLVVEGTLDVDSRGMLVRKASRGKTKPLGMTVTELHKRLLTLHVCGGLNPVWCADRKDTVMWISALYRFFTDQDLDKHKSHLAIYTPPTLVPLSQFRATVATLPGVANRVSKAAEKRFTDKDGKPSIRRAINADVNEWAMLETATDEGKTRRFGVLHATKVVKAIN